MKFRDFYVERLYQDYDGAYLVVRTNSGSSYIMSFPVAFNTNYEVMCDTNYNLVNLVTVVLEAMLSQEHITVNGLYKMIVDQLYQDEFIEGSKRPGIEKHED